MKPRLCPALIVSYGRRRSFIRGAFQCSMRRSRTHPQAYRIAIGVVSADVFNLHCFDVSGEP